MSVYTQTEHVLAIYLLIDMVKQFIRFQRKRLNTILVDSNILFNNILC